ncbi:hypothetical protein G5B31_20875, partial [Rhodobacter sp. SGA-6-6]|uniref:hypothetical protein n=1 Tax=Rhodobacter sp. SGA-6-6 TaxID=2710882 RepID=UPI0013F97538
MPLETIEPTIAPVSQAQAAEMLNVSERSVRAAKTVIAKAAPEVIEAVERDDLSARKAVARPQRGDALGDQRLGI